jgi:hypothetical protein
VDWNSDGEMDVVSGDREGYLNVFIKDDTGLVGYRQYKLMDSTALDVGANSQPAVVDWDGDGKKDLLLGCEAGQVLVYRNQAGDSWPMFQACETLCAGGFPGVPINLNRVNPYVFDLDRDGAHDLVCGANDGYVRFYKNTGSNAVPELAAEETLKVLDGTPILAPGTYYYGSRCGFGYWNSDTLPDFLLSAYDGTVALFRGAELTGVEDGRTTTGASRLALEASPNPSSGSVTISLSPSIPLSLSPVLHIHDAQGRLVLSQPVRTSSFVLNTSTLPAGVYLCRLSAGSDAVSQRIVISR